MQLIFHFIIPVIALLALKIDKKLVFLLAPLTIIPDLDAFTSLHRGLFHNIFFGIFLVIISYFIAKRFYKTTLKLFFFVALFLFLSHLILDFDVSGVAPLFPLDQHVYGIKGLKLVRYTLQEVQLEYVHISFHELIIISILQLLFFNYVFSFRRIIKEKLKNCS